MRAEAPAGCRRVREGPRLRGVAARTYRQSDHPHGTVAAVSTLLSRHRRAAARSGPRTLTLIELIVTIVVGVLAAIAAVGSQAVTERANRSAAEESLRALARETSALAAFDPTRPWREVVEETLAAGPSAAASTTSPYIRAATRWTLLPEGEAPEGVGEVALVEAADSATLTTVAGESQVAASMTRSGAVSVGTLEVPEHRNPAPTAVAGVPTQVAWDLSSPILLADTPAVASPLLGVDDLSADGTSVSALLSAPCDTPVGDHAVTVATAEGAFVPLPVSVQRQTAGPENDNRNCATAVPDLGAGSTWSSGPIDAQHATREPGDAGPTKNVWWSFTPSTTRTVTFTGSLTNSTQVRIAVLSGQGAVTLIERTAHAEASVSVELVAGTTYHVVVGSSVAPGALWTPTLTAQ